jgi:hypothetical protein
MTQNMELTVTQKLRLFLARSGQSVAPWSSVEEVMDRLYGLLYARREQAGLWSDLAALLDTIQSETRGMLAAPDAEILSQSRVTTLVAELRRAVRASVVKPTAGGMRRFAIGKGASVLACIALLAAGFSLGCGSSNSNANSDKDAAVSVPDTNRATDTAATPPVDTAPNLPKDTAPNLPKDTAPNLPRDTAPNLPVDTAPKPSPDAAPKQDASLVLPDSALKDAGTGEPRDASLSPADASGDGSADSTGDALMDLFRDGSPDDIAARLEASVDQKIDTPVYGPGMPAYKGVTFPPEQNA